MEWEEGHMGKGNWERDNGKESALWWLPAGLRTAGRPCFRLCASCRCVLGFSHQKQSKEWVIKLVAPAPGANQQSLFSKPAEIHAFILFVEFLDANFFILVSCQCAEQLEFAVCYVSKIGAKFFLFEASKDHRPVLRGFECRGLTRKPCQLTADECHEVGMAACLRI